MPKRFTATEKWIDPWFCGLKPIEKLFWIYLLDNCDHAGVWQVNWPLVKFHLGDFELNEEAFNGRIVKLKDDKWHIPKFLSFQYGELKPENRMHLSVIHILEKEGAYKGLIRGLIAPMNMDKDKDQVLDKVIKGGVGGKGKLRFYPPTIEEVETYCCERKNNVDPQRWHNYYTANGWKVGKNPMKDWQAAVRTWERRETIGAESNLTKAQRSNLERLKRTMERRSKNDGQEFPGGLSGVSGGFPRTTIQ